MSYIYTSDPAEKPITLTEVKNHLRVDGNTEDDVLNALIDAAVSAAEDYMNRPILVRDVMEVYDCFQPQMILDRATVQEVTSIIYKAPDSSDVTLDSSDFILDKISELARITPATGKEWPSTTNSILAVTIRYKAGWSTAGNVPVSIKHALLLMVGSWYCCREDTVRNLPSASEYLMNNYRIWRFK